MECRIIAGKSMNFVTVTSNRSTDLSHMSYEPHYIPQFVFLGHFFKIFSFLSWRHSFYPALESSSAIFYLGHDCAFSHMLHVSCLSCYRKDTVRIYSSGEESPDCLPGTLEKLANLGGGGRHFCWSHVKNKVVVVSLACEWGESCSSLSLTLCQGSCCPLKGMRD